MSTKWADYIIRHVRRDLRQNHINAVMMCPDLGSSLGTASIYSRGRVVEIIRGGSQVITGPPSRTEQGKILKGEDVRIVRLQGIEYLRTDSNSQPRDNLGELPEF